MAIQDRNILASAGSAKQTLTVCPVTAVSKTAAVIYSFTPGYSFQIAQITTYCLTKAGTVTAAVLVGGRATATLAFTAATEDIATLSTTLANLRGSTSEAITVTLTTDGTGALTFPAINIVFRPYPMNGEATTGP